MTRGESPNLDMLRAIAVSLVLIDHTTGFFLDDPKPRVVMGWLGGLGVALFFVHTSVVLMMSMERSGLAGWALAKWFYIRRAFRIYPLNCVLVLFVFCTGIPQRFLFAHAAQGAPRTALVLLSNLTLTQNLVAQQNLSGQLWSLPIEMNMYVLLPLIFFLTIAYPKGFRWIAWPAAVAVAVLLPHLPMLRNIGNALRYAPMFIPGVLAFNLGKIARFRVAAWLWPALIGAATCVFMLLRSWEFGWIVCLALGCSLPFFREQEHMIVNRICHVVAKYSYGIYLTHLFTIWLAFSYMANAPVYRQVLVFIVATAGLPCVLYHAVERPGIELGKRIGWSIDSCLLNVENRVPVHTISD